MKQHLIKCHMYRHGTQPLEKGGSRLDEMVRKDLEACLAPGRVGRVGAIAGVS